MRKIDPNALNNRDLVNFFSSNDPIAKAARTFRHRGNNIEQKLSQRQPLSPVNMVRLEIEAVQDIANDLSVLIPSTDLKNAPLIKYTLKSNSALKEDVVLNVRGIDYCRSDKSSVKYKLAGELAMFFVGVDVATQKIAYIPFEAIEKIESL